MKLECKDANHVCDKSQYSEASFWEKIKLNIHLIYCRACRKYSMNNGKLTEIVKNSEVTCLEDEVKNDMKKQLDSVIKETQH